MNIHAKKHQLIEWITNISDAYLIEKLIEIAEKTDCLNEISNAEIESIQRGLKDIKENRILDRSDVREKYEKYI